LRLELKQSRLELGEPAKRAFQWHPAELLFLRIELGSPGWWRFDCGIADGGLQQPVGAIVYVLVLPVVVVEGLL
jgi:hypothetical protein